MLLRKPKKGNYKNYSLVRILRKKGKITSEFEVMLNSLPLEEIIAIKLELASRAAGHRLYGLPLWQIMPIIVRDALLKFAMSATRSKTEAAAFIGKTITEYNKFIKKYKTESFFQEKKEKNLDI